MVSLQDNKNFDKKCKDEAINRLTEQIALIKLDGSRKPRTLKENRDRAKEVFGMLMRAGFRKESDENVFQPCEDDLEFLKGMDPALCATLRQGTLVDFCRILHPVDSVLNQKIGCKQGPFDNTTIESSLERKDSIFHLHGRNIENDRKEFQDLTLRANALAKAIVEPRGSFSPPVPVDLLDGHGRMLVCIIKAIMDLGLDPDEVLKMSIFEIDDQVHKYHRYVFPQQDKKALKLFKVSIIKPRPNRGVIYLNFCSITSGGDYVAWRNHFSQSQTIYNWVPHCCKENVLKYIWEVTHPPSCCTVMVSLVIKDVKDDDSVYHDDFKELRAHGDYITGLGFLYLLRKKDLFDAEIVSVRPDERITWKNDDKREPLNVRSGDKDEKDEQSHSSGGWGHAFVTLLVRPKQSRTRKEHKKLQDEFDEWKIVDLQDETMQIGARVLIHEGNNKGKIGWIKSRKVATLTVEDREGDECNVRLTSCKPY